MQLHRQVNHSFPKAELDSDNNVAHHHRINYIIRKISIINFDRWWVLRSETLN